MSKAYTSQAYGSSPQTQRTRYPTWERTPKWHWRRWLLRQTWCYYNSKATWGGAKTHYKTEVQMAKHLLTLRYDPSTPCSAPVDLGAVMGMPPIGVPPIGGTRRARV